MPNVVLNMHDCVTGEIKTVKIILTNCSIICNVKPIEKESETNNACFLHILLLLIGKNHTCTCISHIRSHKVSIHVSM